MSSSPPTTKQLARARDEFRALLETETSENDWQRFFGRNPHVLSLSLPLRLEPRDIVPLGRPGKTEPDFIFFPRTMKPVPYYGVIEIKKPDSPIVQVTRKNAAILSRDAETAIQQSKTYLRDARSLFPFELDRSMLFLGNSAHIFVIMGMSKELAEKLGNELYREMIQERLPANLQLLPYDTLLQTFEASFTPAIHVLVPASVQLQSFTQRLFDTEVPQAFLTDASQAKRIGAVYQICISGEDGGDWVVDCASDPPTCRRGNPGSADCTMSMSAEDFERFYENPNANALGLFFEGRMRVSGNQMLAMRLQTLFPPSEAKAGGKDQPAPKRKRSPRRRK